MTSTEQDNCKRYVWFGPYGDGLELRFEPTFDIALGSTRRAKAVIRRVLRVLRKWRLEATLDDIGARAIIPTSSFQMSALLAAIDAEIAAFKSERIHAKVVEEILAISAQERLRWTKNGRLPTSGHTSFQNGKKSIFLVLYPAAAIASLARSPEQVEAWRQADTDTAKHAVRRESKSTA
ncbi:hypothetical protein [Rhodopseudomonas pseudopalustris]|uniref:Uncharacterized protein n=1 Tax=Rhodopseudomonas pseudopalustris TaxID=1513892 RepID=A0A1H8UF69_9BRAD|nr:hypothetical protein [Rhodopseudomonas pseudopalustris]SEP01736.1 hypothetical protein SAMN05444123_10711 [Rhodopseudomonas pseudopalustris]